MLISIITSALNREKSYASVLIDINSTMDAQQEIINSAQEVLSPNLFDKTI